MSSAAEQAHPRSELLQTSAAAASEAAAPRAGSSVFGWIASKTRSVGGGCLRVIASPAAGTLIFTSVCLVLAYKHKKASSTRPAAADQTPPQQPHAVRSVSRSISFAMLQGGQKAMERLRAIRKAASADDKGLTSSVSGALEYLSEELRGDNLQKKQLDFVKLYGQIGILEMSKMEDEAIKVLQNAHEKVKGPPHSHNAHEIELLLVEMMIFKGDYKKAPDYTCLSSKDDVSATDPRVPLYKTIIYAMMNEDEKNESKKKEDEKKVKDAYDEFRRIRDQFHGPKYYKYDSSTFFEVPDFDEFKEIVKTLKEEIKEAHDTVVKSSPAPAAKAETNPPAVSSPAEQPPKTPAGKQEKSAEPSEKAAAKGDQT